MDLASLLPDHLIQEIEQQRVRDFVVRRNEMNPDAGARQHAVAAWYYCCAARRSTRDYFYFLADMHIDSLGETHPALAAQLSMQAHHCRCERDMVRNPNAPWVVHEFPPLLRLHAMIANRSVAIDQLSRLAATDATTDDNNTDALWCIVVAEANFALDLYDVGLGWLAKAIDHTDGKIDNIVSPHDRYIIRSSIHRKEKIPPHVFNVPKQTRWYCSTLMGSRLDTLEYMKLVALYR